MNEFEVKVLDGLQGVRTELSGLSERIARVETKLDVANQRIDGHETRLTKLEDRVPDPDHESRLRKLERTIWIASGTALAGGAGLGSVLSSITGS